MKSAAELREIQREYYRRTAVDYDAMHEKDEASQLLALRYLDGLVEPLGLRNLLDVGAGTGRAARFFGEHRPDFTVHSLEPVPELMASVAPALRAFGGQLSCGSGDALPFRNASFDAVCEFAVLHHVPDPDTLVREMTRVARRAIFLSDSNRFGQGPWPARWVKLGLWKAGLWPLAFRLRTNGRGYVISEGDGLAYSYSVYDSYDRLASWATHMIAFPTSLEPGTGWFSPLLTSSHVLLCAIRD